MIVENRNCCGLNEDVPIGFDMKMERVERILAMINDAVVNAYNCGEPLFTNHTTSLSLEKEDVLKKVEQNISNPMSFRGFIKRMQTYNIVCWYAHRRLALQLARRGWENVKDYVVRCCFCTAEMDLIAHISSPEDELLKLLSKRHASFCRWLTITSPEFFACVPYVQSSQGLKNTVTANATLLLEYGEELPKIPEIVLHKMKLEHDTLELLICGLLKDVPVNEISISAVALTLCGWSPASTKGILCCCYCDRRIALRHWMSLQEFDEQRRLLLSDNNNMKICSISYMQSSFTASRDEEEEGSESPLSDQSVITDCSDDEEEVDEENEMEEDEYEIYEKQAEEQDCVSRDDDEMDDDDDDEQSSKIKNCQNKDNRENKYEKFENHDSVQDVEMEEQYDVLNVEEFDGNNFNEGDDDDDDDDVDEDTEGEMLPNEDGPSDEDAPEVEISDESIISDNEEFKNEKSKPFKNPRKHTQYQSNDKNKEYSRVFENQYDSCANDDELDSSEDDLLDENEGEEEEEEVDEEEEENEHDESEEIGEEEDDEEDDDDDEDDDDEDDEDDEMPEDSKDQENYSVSFINLADSDEEIPQPKEKIQSLPCSTPVMVSITDTIEKKNETPNENKQNSSKKLCNENETKMENSNNDDNVSENSQLQKHSFSDSGIPLECENQEEKSSDLTVVEITGSINLKTGKTTENNTFEGESLHDRENCMQQEKSTLKRKRVNHEDKTDSQLSTKRKHISLDESAYESQVNLSGKIRRDGELKDNKDDVEMGESTCNEGTNKKVEALHSIAHSRNGNDCKAPIACKDSVVEEVVEYENNHSEGSKLNDTCSVPKNDCELEVSHHDGKTSVVVGNNLKQAETESIKQDSLSSVGVSETPEVTQDVRMPLPATPKSEVNSDATLTKNEIATSEHVAHTSQKQTESAGKLMESSSTNMPILLPEVQSESGSTTFREPGCNLEDATCNMPVLVREVGSANSDAGQVKAVGSAKEDEPAALAAAQVVQDGGAVTVQTLGEEEKKEVVQLDASQPPGAEGGEDVLVAVEVVQNTSEEKSKEDFTLGGVNCSVEPSVHNEKNSKSEVLTQLGECVKDTAISNVTENQMRDEAARNIEIVSEEIVCESKPSEANTCTGKPNTQESENNDKCSSDKLESDKTGGCIIEACESGTVSVPTEPEDGADQEAMEVCEAGTGQQTASRGVKRNRESDSEQSPPAAKRLHQSKEVQKQPSLLDPTSEHRFWCLWATSKGTASYNHKSGCEIVFQEILEKIIQQRQEQEHVDIAGKLQRTQEQIIPL